MNAQNATIDLLVQDDRNRLLNAWIAEALGSSRALGSAASLDGDARLLLDALLRCLRAGADVARFESPAWSELRDALENVSSSRAAQGASAAATSQFVLALKRPLFLGLQERADDAPALIDGVLWASTLVDNMAQLTVSAYQATREQIIGRQQHELLELSTPVVKLWDGVLAVPMIGTLDSNRTQQVMETLLQRIVDTGSQLAIIDITGVPTVDTLVAQHLLKTVTAIRLMGAECIISGVRPQIAQTIVHLGIDLHGITTKATLADALALALRNAGYSVSRVAH